MIRSRHGFTFAEFMVVVLMIGILAGIALLRYIDLKHRALSAHAVVDLETIRLAAYHRWADSTKWPAEVRAGVTPPDMAPYLARGFSFSRRDYTLDWENCVPARGGRSGTMQLGVVLTSSNRRLMNVLRQSVGPKQPFFMVGNRLTFVIIGPDGQS